MGTPSTYSTDTWEGVGEKHAAEIEIETKTWGNALIPIQKLVFNWSKVQPEHQDFLYSPGDINGQPRLRNPTKDPFNNTHTFNGSHTFS